MPQQPGHAPGWSGRRDDAGRIDHPWIGMRGCTIHVQDVDPFPFVGGVCQDGWHTDCPQAPFVTGHQPEQCDGRHPTRCLCPCHHHPPPTVEQAPTLFDLIPT